MSCLRCAGTNNNNSYVGETDRPCQERFSEPIRAAKKPQSYMENAVGKHYQVFHRGWEPDFKVCILDQDVSVRRKISEAKRIITDKPAINDSTFIYCIL